MTTRDPKLLLVGTARQLPGDFCLTENLLEFYQDFFQRSQEIKTPAEVSRCIRYECSLPGGSRSLFAGIAVPEVQDIPAGMVAWILGPASWECIRVSPVGKWTTVHRKIEWRQPSRSRGAGGSEIPGDFFIRDPDKEGVGTPSEQGVYRMTAYACRNRSREIDDGDRVKLVAYDPVWPEQYSRFSDWLRDHAGPDLVLRVEHYGSTAIPGIPAKPVIDVLAEVPSFAAARERLLPVLLVDNRWEYWWYEDRMTFIRRDTLVGKRTHHLHVAPKGHRIWNQLAFRDYLITHPDDAADYAALKQDLAEKYPDDRERYTLAKAGFIQIILHRARSEGPE